MSKGNTLELDETRGDERSSGWRSFGRINMYALGVSAAIVPNRSETSTKFSLADRTSQYNNNKYCGLRVLTNVRANKLTKRIGVTRLRKERERERERERNTG